MLLSTRLIDLETKHRIDLEMCSERHEKSLNELRQRLDASEKRSLQLEAKFMELKNNSESLN